LPALPQLSLLFRREPCPCMPLHSHTSSSAKIRRCCVDSLNSPSKADTLYPQSGQMADVSVCPPCAKSPLDSFGLDICRSHHLAPLLGFVGDELTEIGGRADK